MSFWSTPSLRSHFQDNGFEGISKWNKTELMYLFTLKELKEQCKHFHVAGYSNKDKDSMIQLMLEHPKTVTDNKGNNTFYDVSVGDSDSYSSDELNVDLRRELFLKPLGKRKANSSEESDNDSDRSDYYNRLEVMRNSSKMMTPSKDKKPSRKDKKPSSKDTKTSGNTKTSNKGNNTPSDNKRAKVIIKGKQTSTHKRIALVIGNADYEHMPKLKNTIRDAKLMRDTLTEIGFEVMYLRNTIDHSVIQTAIRELLDKVDSDTIVFFYYAGHACQFAEDARAHNYIIPVSVSLEFAEDIGRKCVQIHSALIKKIMNQKPYLLINVLDACRNNPNLPSDSRSVTKGLAKEKQTAGTIIGFSCDAEQVAKDGDGKNSLYTLQLAKFLKRRESIVRVFSKVSDQMKELCPGQTPWSENNVADAIHDLCL